MLALLVPIALVAGAYFAGTRGPHPGSQDPAEARRTQHGRAADSVPVWVWVMAAAVLAVGVLGDVPAPMFFGGPGPLGIFGP